MATAIDAKGAKRFLLRNPEKAEHNQYWYSPPTIEVLAGEAVALASVSTEGSAPCRIAFISTPSLYFAVPAAQREASCWVLDIDRKWAKDPHFVYYDFNDNEGCLGAELRVTQECYLRDDVACGCPLCPTCVNPAPRLEGDATHYVVRSCGRPQQPPARRRA